MCFVVTPKVMSFQISLSFGKNLCNAIISFVTRYSSTEVIKKARANYPIQVTDSK